ncbi:MAG: hypothetical protein P4L99_27970 [Chthoniobacter sp.]|nr:hypothetical protein [Chthoniobacter sp.]
MKEWLILHPVRVITILFAVVWVGKDVIMLIMDRRRLRRMANKERKLSEPKGGQS